MTRYCEELKSGWQQVRVICRTFACYAPGLPLLNSHYKYTYTVYTPRDCYGLYLDTYSGPESSTHYDLRKYVQIGKTQAKEEEILTYLTKEI